MSTAASSVLAAPVARRIGIVAGLLALAAVLGFAIYNGRDGSDPMTNLSNAANRAANGTANAFRTVTDLLAGRSPGERATGALANLKHKRQAALHQRALPKTRRPAAAALPSILPPGIPEEVPIAAAPLYALVAGLPPAETIPGGGGPVGPPGGFPIIPPGGGGGIIVPPIIVPPGPPPPPPPPPAVPEPATWAMMLMGFLAIGGAVRRRRLPVSAAAAS